MGNYCVMCGAPIPEGQRTCSMCYGDMEHGRDGYYRQWAEEQERQEQERREQERASRNVRIKRRGRDGLAFTRGGRDEIYG